MTLTEQALRLNYASGRRDLPALILMSDESRLPDPRAAAERLPPGSAILIRHSDARARQKLVEDVAPICHARELFLIVSDDIALAEAIGANGLHLPERRAASPLALTWRRRWRGLLTCAAHNGAALRRAAQLSADAALLSPVFATASHPDGASIGGLRFRTLARASSIPLYALGGVTRANARQLSGIRNLVGIAGIGAIREEH